MNETSSYSWLSEAVSDGTLIVTANLRLARELRVTYNDNQAHSGALSWLTPEIHSLQGWLAARYDEVAIADGRIRLSAQAAVCLWENCLDEVLHEPLQNRSAFARQCADTWTRVMEWAVPAESLMQQARSGDERLFARVARRYLERLEERNLIDSAGVIGHVAAAIRDGNSEVPEKVMFAGFERMSPVMTNLLQALASRGCVVGEIKTGSRVPQVRVASYEHADAELRAAGVWARNIIEGDPAATIAVVRPGLERDAQRSARLVREGFMAGWQCSGEETRAAVDVSYGQRLSDYPAIHIALLYLRWASGKLTSREIGAILRSRSIDAGAGCSRLELALRGMPERPWTPAALLSALRGMDESADAAAWLGGVGELAGMREEFAGFDSPARWAAKIDQLLGTIGWPGTRSLSSGEFQLINRWRDLLNEFSALTIVTHRMKADAAVQTITTMAGDALFQPESIARRVQVLGPLEAAGLEFDHLWICAMDSLTWPPASRPLSLVSRQLQREFRMPDSTPNDTLQFAQQVLDSLVSSATQTVISWARMSEEGDRTPSRLLAPFPIADDEPAVDPGWHALKFASPDSLQVIHNDKAPSLLDEEQVHGGAYTVQRQYTDPVSAFAFGRLGLREIQRFETGIAARTRGTIVHRALRELYSELPDSTAIATWDTGERERRTQSAAAAATERYRRNLDRTHRQLLRLEEERLGELLRDFLEAEKEERGSFSLAAVEHDLSLEKDGLRLDMRVDRVDRLPDGTSLIADYKTGSVKPFTNRHGEPYDLQLVVYSCAWPEFAGGLVLINVETSGIRYRGTGDSTEWKKKNDEEWTTRLAGWQQLVYSAMRAIAGGDVRVNVQLASDKTRPLALLSRIEELRRED